jgi:hypothetical protein
MYDVDRAAKPASRAGPRLKSGFDPSGGVMRKLQFTLSFLVLILAASFALSCGASQGPGQLQSITVSPATADAEAPFTATGYYIHPSHTVTPQPATWVACHQGAPTTDVTVTTTGTAQCASGAAGTYSVTAFVPTPACEVMSGPCGGGCEIVGTAQLTCP